MELSAAVRRRRMVRSFDPAPVAPDVVDRLLDLARRVPSAGNSQALAFFVLEGADTARLWDVTLPPERRATFRWRGALRAPVVVVALGGPGGGRGGVRPPGGGPGAGRARPPHPPAAGRGRAPGRMVTEPAAGPAAGPSAYRWSADPYPALRHH